MNLIGAISLGDLHDEHRRVSGRVALRPERPCTGLAFDRSLALNRGHGRDQRPTTAAAVDQELLGFRAHGVGLPGQTAPRIRDNVAFQSHGSNYRITVRRV